MSALALTQNKSAIGINLQASFQAIGGTGPYTYSVRAGGAGGSINSSTGLYTAPAVVNAGSYGPPKFIYDTIQANDSAAAQVTSQILVGNALLLFCDIIQTELSLPQGRCYLWDQKLFQPTDSGLYVAVSVVSCKPFGSVNAFDGSGSNSNSVQFVNIYNQLQVDIISRDTEARDRKEEVIMALNSDYSRNQQTGNSFYIGQLPPGAQFTNLSEVDGAAIPYRFAISVAMQYFVTKTIATPSYDSFSTTQVNTNP